MRQDRRSRLGGEKGAGLAASEEPTPAPVPPFVLVENMRPSLVFIPGADLIPGMNQVPSATWAAFSDTTMGKALQSDAILVPMTFENISKLSTPHQRSIVAKTYDVVLLQSWMTEAWAADLQAAITAQIVALAAPAAPAETSADEPPMAEV